MGKKIVFKICIKMELNRNDHQNDFRKFPPTDMPQFEKYHYYRMLEYAQMYFKFTPCRPLYYQLPNPNDKVPDRIPRYIYNYRKVLLKARMNQLHQLNELSLDLSDCSPAENQKPDEATYRVGYAGEESDTNSNYHEIESSEFEDGISLRSNEHKGNCDYKSLIGETEDEGGNDDFKNSDDTMSNLIGEENEVDELEIEETEEMEGNVENEEIDETEEIEEEEDESDSEKTERQVIEKIESDIPVASEKASKSELTTGEAKEVHETEGELPRKTLGGGDEISKECVLTKHDEN